MCVFTGFLGHSSTTTSDWPVLLERTGCAVATYGPDNAGVWTDIDAAIGLVHRHSPRLEE